MLEFDQPIKQVEGKLRFLPDICELHWSLSANVFRGGKGDHNVVEIPYSKIDEVELRKKWLRPTQINFHVSNPELVKEIPGIVMGNLSFEIEKRSTKDLERLKSFIDFKQSLFLFERNDAYLKELREDNV